MVVRAERANAGSPRFARSVRDAARGAARWAATPVGLASLFLAGLLLRLWLARGGGFPYDMGTFAAWATKLASVGLSDFYPKTQEGLESYFVDYPPGYMYVLWLLGRASRRRGASSPPVFLLKLPGILADLGLAWVVALLTQRLTPRALGRALPWRGVAAAAVLLNPAVFFVSATWGQVDSILALLVLGAFLLLGTGQPSARREVAAVCLLTLALLTKPQAAFVLPLAVLLLVWRHVRRPVVEGDPRSAVLAGLGRVLALGLIAVAFAIVILVPFGIGPAYALRFYTHAAATYEFTSVWAFNFWGAVAFWRPDLEGEGVVRVLGVPALLVGLGLFAAGTVALLWRAWRSLSRGELEGRVLAFGGAALTCLAFAVLTRIHERYLFLAIACLAPLVAYRALRRSMLVLSLLYLTNVYFAYVYYVEYVQRRAFRIPGYELLFGTINDSSQKKIISLITAVVCVALAARGWRWLESRSGIEQQAHDEPAHEARLEIGAPPAREEPAPVARRPWTLDLHPIGRVGAALAGVVFVVAALTRVIGLGSPPGMYFDEVYHARTAGEYLQGKEVYEWTHPPLAKEIMAISIRYASRFGVHGTGPVPEPLRGAPGASDGTSAVWGVPRDDGGWAVSTRFRDRCGVSSASRPVAVPVRPAVVAPAEDGSVVGGVGPAGPALARVASGSHAWTALLPGAPKDVTTTGATSFVVTEEGQLVRVGEQGEVSALADGAADVATSPKDGTVWATFPSRNSVEAWGADGVLRHRVAVQGRPGPVVASEGDRVLVGDLSSARIESIDVESRTRTDALAVRAVTFAEIPETGLVWASSGREIRVIEPRGLSVLGRATLPETPRALLADTAHGRVLATGSGEFACASGEFAFGWRFGSAIFGAAMIAFVFLVALRLIGSVLAAALAALFVTVDGLAFVLARMAMNDSYVTAFLLAAWFCTLSALFAWGWNPARRRARGAALAWLAAAGVAAGGAIASKWVGVYGLLAIGLLLLWDVVHRRRESILGAAGSPLAGLVLLALVFGVVPAGIYVASYIPYFSLGHDFADFLHQTAGMYGYHSGLKASHPYGSPWYGWPVGHRAVWLYVGTHGAERAEIWTLMNPVVAIGGAVGLVLVGLAAWRRRSLALVVLPVAALAQYLPWVAVTRVTFLYHYLPVVPFLAIAFAWWLTIGRKGVQRRRFEIGAVAIAAVTAFALVLPVVDAWFVSPAYIDVIKVWLPWMF